MADTIKTITEAFKTVFTAAGFIESETNWRNPNDPLPIHSEMFYTQISGDEFITVSNEHDATRTIFFDVCFDVGESMTGDRPGLYLDACVTLDTLSAGLNGVNVGKWFQAGAFEPLPFINARYITFTMPIRVNYPVCV